MSTGTRLERLEQAVYGECNVSDDKATIEHLIAALRQAEKRALDEHGALIGISISAKEIKRILKRLKSGERELEQALIDIDREAEYIIRQAEQSR